MAGFTSSQIDTGIASSTPDVRGGAVSRAGFTLGRMAEVVLLVLGLPMVGIVLKGARPTDYLGFPPVLRHVQHAAFSWGVFALYATLIAVFVVPLLTRAVLYRGTPGRAVSSQAFPWFGWAGVALGSLAWVVAWTRFDGLRVLQPYTFSPLWIAYILVVNALTMRRTGTCVMRSQPRAFAWLFVASAAFWWCFEYLNRFVENWTYVHIPTSGLAYFLYATLPFATVLPAVVSTREWLLSFPRLVEPYRRWVPVRAPRPRWLAGGALGVAAFGLAAIGVWPNALFPLLWVSPCLVFISLRGLRGQAHVLSGIARGDWSVAVASAFAALVCGFFWEMWNYASLAKWIYAVPYVHRFLVFEMPFLGYAGYLPFGLECAMIADLFLRGARSESDRVADGSGLAPRFGG